MIIVDTDVLIEWLEKNSSKQSIIEACLSTYNEIIATTALNFEELLFGYFKRKGNTIISKSHPIWGIVTIPFTLRDALLAAKIEYEMEKKGKKKPRGDVLIAAITINNNASLFTLNKKHFNEISDLKLIDCTA